MTLKKEAITRSLFHRLVLSKSSSARPVETPFEIIKRSLESGDVFNNEWVWDLVGEA
jgi:hypothetical protein